MIRWPLTPDKLAELIQLIAELEVARDDGERVEIRFNAMIPATGLSRAREVDLLVTYRVAGRVFRRIVEVQARNRKIGQQFVDAVMGKMSQLGVDRATLVSEAGFTADALARIRASRGRIDAVHLAPPDLTKWKVDPAVSTTFIDENGAKYVQDLSAHVEVEFIGRPETFIVLAGTNDELKISSFLVVGRPREGKDRDVRFWVLGDVRSSTATRATISYTQPDGRRGQSTSVPSSASRIRVGGI